MYPEYPRKSIYKTVHEWAHDIIGEEERVLPIIKELLTHFEVITSLWKNDLAYQETTHEKTRSLANCHAFGDFNLFRKYINSGDYQEKINEMLEQGNSFPEARKIVVQYFAIISKLEIYDDKEFEAFYDEWNNLTRINASLENIKRLIILENSELIFHKCQLINLIRRKNAAYRYVIGQDVFVENILGENGKNLTASDPNAFRYVLGLENEELELDNKRMVIELNQRGRK